MNTDTVGRQAFQVLRQAGITTVFGNPGSTELALYRDWPDDFRYVLALNEASALAMADGHASVSGHPALANLHSAAGVGNALGMLVNTYVGQSPVVILAGQQRRSLLDEEPLLFARDATQFPRPYVKWAVEPALPEQVPRLLAQAIRIAATPPRGPVFVSVPEDDWGRPASANPGPWPLSISPTMPETMTIDRLADALHAAQRPAFVVGAGTDSEAGWRALCSLAEGLQAPVWCAPLAHRIGFHTAHRLFAGFLTPRTDAVRTALEGRDLVVVAGARAFMYHVAGEGPALPPGTAVAVLTDAPEAPMPTGAIVLAGSPVLALEALAARLGFSAGAPQSAPRGGPRKLRHGSPMAPDRVLRELSARLPIGSVLVEEAATHRDEIQDQVDVVAPRSYFTCAGGGLGWALPAAVGVALAEPQRRIVALLGDGAAMYTIQALFTAAREGLQITVVILNNGGYAAIRLLSRAEGVELPAGACEVTGLDFPAIARSLGCDAGRVADAKQLSVALETALRAPGPYLLDVVLDDVGADIYPQRPSRVQSVL